MPRDRLFSSTTYIFIMWMVGASVVLFAIACIPVIGQLIVAIIGAIDAVVALVCAAAGVEETRVGQVLCGGISGLLAQYFTPYGYNVMVNIAEEGRFQLAAPFDYTIRQFNPFDYAIRHPEQGLAVGNSLQFTTTVRNTIDFAEFPLDWKALAYAWQWNELALRSSAFEYRWQVQAADIHENVTFGGQFSSWETDGWTRRFPWLSHRLYMLVSPTGDDAPLDEAGINRPLRLSLAEGYALPAQECILVPSVFGLLPVCWVRSDKGTNHTDLGKMFAFDVFPATLDGFYQAAAKNGGYSLAWGQDVTITTTVGTQSVPLVFPRMKDFDGDGLLNSTDRGSDPDDSRWDTDGDGLSDYFELRHGSDPARFDTDGDGLNDYEEFLLGADPNRQDSDGDGLTDRQEVDGWEFVYAFDPVTGEQLRTWVTSDPLDTDTDGDGLPDFKEYVFGLNPRVVSDPNVLGLEARVVESGLWHDPNDLVVRGGDTLRYTSTVQNRLLGRQAQGLFSLNSSAPAVLNTSGVPPVSFVLPPLARTTLSGTLAVSSVTASQPVSLTQVAGALITDWRAQSNFAEMWLRLEEGATATQFVDSSGSIPLRNANCSGNTCPARQQSGYLGYGVRFDGVDDRLVVQDSPGFDFGTGGLTIAMWVNKTNSGRGSLLNWRNTQDNLDVYVDGTTLKVDLRVDGSGGPVVSSGGTVGLNEWHHVAVVRDGAGNWTTYIDGVSRGSGASAADLNKALRQRGAMISNGYGDLKEKCFRIAHMGDLQIEDIRWLLAQIEDILGL